MRYDIYIYVVRRLKVNLGKRCLLRYALYCDFTESRIVFSYGRFGRTHRSRLQVGPKRIKIGPTVCPETSVMKLTFYGAQNPKNCAVLVHSAAEVQYDVFATTYDPMPRFSPLVFFYSRNPRRLL